MGAGTTVMGFWGHSDGGGDEVEAIALTSTYTSADRVED